MFISSLNISSNFVKLLFRCHFVFFSFCHQISLVASQLFKCDLNGIFCVWALEFFISMQRVS